MAAAQHCLLGGNAGSAGGPPTLISIFIRSTALRSGSHAKSITKTSLSSGANTRRAVFADTSMLLASVCNAVNCRASVTRASRYRLTDG
jgi:hypothetical protein